MALCVADKDILQAQAFAFLEDLHKGFMNSYSQETIESAMAYSFQFFRNDLMIPKLKTINDNLKKMKDEQDKNKAAVDALVESMS